MSLKAFFSENPSVALAFSGGVDSSYLLYAGLSNGAKVKAYYMQTAFQPAFELEDARRLAEGLNADLTILRGDVLGAAHVMANPPDRCYHCKRIIFEAIQAQAIEDGFSVIIDGTNASDDSDDRPGMRALAELSVRSPLRESGITKDEVRRLSKDAGLFTWDKPAYACLATRIPTGRAITQDLLQKVEATEDILFALGFSDFRVRVLNDMARLEIPGDQMPRILEQKEQILQRFKPHFTAVLMDLAER